MLLSLENGAYVLRGVTDETARLLTEMRWQFVRAGEWFTRSPYLAAPFFNHAHADDWQCREALYPFAWNYGTSFAKAPIEGLPGAIMRAGSDTPYPYQVAGVQRGAAQQNMIIGDPPGLGKAQPITAKIATPYGWRRMGELVVGDIILGANGRPQQITGVFPQGLAPIFKIVFSDGASTECCLNHLWRTRNHGSAWRVVSLIDMLIGHKFKVKNRTYNILPGVLTPCGRRKYDVPITDAVVYKKRNNFIKPYLLGALIGDGMLGHNSITFSTIDEEIRNRIAAELPVGVTIKHKKGADYGLTGIRPLPNILRYALDMLGLRSHGDHKFIPDNYKFSSIEDRTALLRGLMDTDGTILKDGTVQFSSNSERLTDDVREVIMSLGGLARKTSKISKSKKLHYILTIAMPDWCNPFYVKRKANKWRPRQKYKPSRHIVKVEYVGIKYAQCISVSNKDCLYITDEFILTHNTLQAIGVMNARQPRRALIACPAHLAYNWADEVARRCAFQSSISILDKARKFVPEAGICILPYSRAMSYWRALIAGGAFDIVVLDEFHDLKAHEAQRSRPFWGYNDAPGVVAYARSNLALSGTPQLNNPSELYNVIASYAPHLVAGVNREKFIQIYCSTREFGATVKKRNGGEARVKVIKIEEGKFDAALNAELRASGLLVRRAKSEVLTQLPSKRLFLAYLPPTGEIEELVREETSLYEMLQIKDFTAQELMTIKGHVATVRRKLGILKVPSASQYILDHFRNGETHVMAFAIHTSVIDGIAENVGKHGIKVLIFDGRSSPKKRHEFEVEFQAGHGRYLALLQITAAGTGHTLTRACHGIGVERSWVPGRNDQVEDRIHRITQTREVEITSLAYQHSVEAKVLRSGARKEKSAERVLDVKLHEMLEQIESEA